MFNTLKSNSIFTNLKSHCFVISHFISQTIFVINLLLKMKKKTIRPKSITHLISIEQMIHHKNSKFRLKKKTEFSLGKLFTVMWYGFLNVKVFLQKNCFFFIYSLCFSHISTNFNVSNAYVWIWII